MRSIYRVKVIFCGARKLGIACLKELKKYDRREIELIGAVMPGKEEKVWWSDIVDEDEVKKLGIRLLDRKDPAAFNQADLLFSVLYPYIFKQKVIGKVKYGLINLHPAPLPGYRGANGNAHAILNGEKKFGITLHYITEEVDAGPVIRTSWLKIFPHDTGKTLYERTHRLGKKLFAGLLPLILSEAQKGRKVEAVPQLDASARYYSRDSLSDKEVNLLFPYKKIYDFVRALQFPPFEPAYFLYKNRKIHLSVNKGRIILLRNLNAGL